MAGWWLSHPSEKYESVGIIIPNGKTKFCSKPPISTSIYITIWKDPPFYSWVNQLFRLGHGFKFANCKRLPGRVHEYTLQDPSKIPIFHNNFRRLWDDSGFPARHATPKCGSSGLPSSAKKYVIYPNLSNINVWNIYESQTISRNIHKHPYILTQHYQGIYKSNKSSRISLFPAGCDPHQHDGWSRVWAGWFPGSEDGGASVPWRRVLWSYTWLHI